MITANRVMHCNADTPEEMHHWITLLQRSKGDTRVDGQEFIIRGDNTCTGTYVHQELVPTMNTFHVKTLYRGVIIPPQRVLH